MEVFGMFGLSGLLGDMFELKCTSSARKYMLKIMKVSLLYKYIMRARPIFRKCRHFYNAFTFSLLIRLRDKDVV